MSTPNRPRRHCTICGIETRSADACQQCTRYANLAITDEHALPPGEWVKRGNVLVFEPTEVQVKAAPRGTRPGENPGYDCGTHRAYGRHNRLGQEACAPCKRANAEQRATDRHRVLVASVHKSPIRLEAERLLAEINALSDRNPEKEAA